MTFTSAFNSTDDAVAYLRRHTAPKEPHNQLIRDILTSRHKLTPKKRAWAHKIATELFNTKVTDR